MHNRIAPAFGVRRVIAAFTLVIALSTANAADSATNAAENTATNLPTISTNREGERPREPRQADAQTSSQPTNASPSGATSTPTSTKDTTGFDEFKLITQRNIFDPNRRAPRPPGSRREEVKPTRIDYINLVGAMSYEKGRFAFFDGNSSEYRKSVKPGDTIAGYKVSDVTQNKVTLQRDDKKIELPVGGQLKREDEGEWRLNSSPENFAASTNSTDSSSTSSSSGSSSSSSNSSSSSDESNPILKRLMEQRRQGK